MTLETSASTTEEPGAAQAEQGQPATGAETSATPAEQQDQGAKQSPLDIVKGVLDAERAQRESEADGQRKASESPAEAKGADGAKEPTDGAAEPKDDKQARNFAALRQEVAAFKERAEKYDQLSGYLNESGLTADEFAAGLGIMRMMKSGDPNQALKALLPFVESLQSVVGEKIPADIQDKVDRGLLDEDSAKELARSRAAVAVANQRREQEQARLQEFSERTAAEREQQAAEQNAQRIGAAVSAWEKSWGESDPDYKAKHRLVMDRVVALMQSEGVPSTPDAAVAQAERARKEIDEWYASTVGHSKRPITTVTGGAGNSTRATPKSPLDVAKAALGMAH